jgi:hypothetical protein
MFLPGRPIANSNGGKLVKTGSFHARGIAVFAALLTVLVSAGCSDRPAQERFKWFEMVSSVIDAKQKTGQPTYLDVVRVLPFGWEKMYVFPPRTPIADIDKSLGFKWRGAKKTRIDERDDITLLVFVIGRTVQAAIEHPIASGDFSRLRAGYAYTPREGYFEVKEETTDGRTTFYFVEAQRYK